MQILGNFIILSLLNTGVHLVVSSGLNNYQRCHVLGYNEGNPTTPTSFLTTGVGGVPNYIISAGGEKLW